MEPQMLIIKKNSYYQNFEGLSIFYYSFKLTIMSYKHYVLST